MLKRSNHSIFTKSFQSLLIAALCLGLFACMLPGAHNPNARGAGKPGNLNVAITTHLGDQARFIKGDEIQFLLSLNQSCYVLLLYRDAGNRLWQLFPNQMRQEQKLPAGDFMNFPLAEDGIRITVGAPYGEEQVLLYASNKPLPELSFSQSSNGLRQLKDNIEDVDYKIRKHSARSRAVLALDKNTITTAER